MAFDKSKDKVLMMEELESGLRVSIHAYNDGEAKLQIGPRVYTKKNGDEGFGKAGRLSLKEAVALAGLMPRISEVMGGMPSESLPR